MVPLVFEGEDSFVVLLQIPGLLTEVKGDFGENLGSKKSGCARGF